MLYKEYLAIKNIALHNVGNKLNQDEILFSKTYLDLNEDIESILIEYFISPFKTEEFYHFYHDTDLSLNETYTYVSSILNNPDTLLEQSINLAKHLYNQSVHPKIKAGEFYVVYFKDCILNGDKVDALGLFKSETKDTFLQIERISDGFDIESQQGVNINKFDKGCLIYNTEKDKGFTISIVDNTNKGIDAQYWKDSFLNLKPCSDSYHHTKEFLDITKNFLTKQVSEEFEIGKTDKIDMLNRSVDYFKTHDSFNKEEFESEVFTDENVIESFRNYDSAYRETNEISVVEDFEISAQAVKKQARAFKSVLKLDKNFHVYIHGDKNLIEKGQESDGRKFYKIYYDSEE